MPEDHWLQANVHTRWTPMQTIDLPMSSSHAAVMQQSMLLVRGWSRSSVACKNVRGFPGISADFHVGRLVRGTFAGESPQVLSGIEVPQGEEERHCVHVLLFSWWGIQRNGDKLKSYCFMEENRRFRRFFHQGWLFWDPTVLCFTESKSFFYGCTSKAGRAKGRSFKRQIMSFHFKSLHIISSFHHVYGWVQSHLQCIMTCPKALSPSGTRPVTHAASKAQALRRANEL